MQATDGVPGLSSPVSAARRVGTTWTLQRRVFLTLLPLVALVLGLGSAGTALLGNLGGQIGEILRENYASVVAMERLNESLERIDSSFQFGIAGQTAAAAARYQANWPRYRANLRIEQDNITVPGEQEAVENLTALTERYQSLGDAFYARAAGDPQRQRDYFGDGGLLDAFKGIKAASAAIRDMNQANMEAASRRAKATAASSAIGLEVGLVSAIMLAALLAWYTSRSLVAPIKALTKSAVGISRGQLEQRVSYASGDELGELARAFNEMVEQLGISRHAVELRSAELREAEAKYRSIFENALEGIFQSTPDGRYVTVNHALADMLGYASGSELMASVQHIGDQIYADRGRSVELRRRLVHDGAVRGFEALCIRKDESKVWLSFNTRAVRDHTGAVLLYEGFVTDVTARKQGEHEVSRLAHLHAVVADLGQRALRLDASVNIQHEATELVATTLGVEFVNVMELLPDGKSFLLRAGVGWKEGQVGSMIVTGEGTQPGFTLHSARTVVVEDAASETRFVPVARILGEQLTSSLSVVILMGHGPYGTLGAHARQRRTFTQDELNFMRSIANVLGAAIERRRAEDALSVSEANLNRAQEIAHLGSWQLDVVHDRLTWSEEVFRIFGLPRDAPLSYEAFLATIHPDDRTRVAEAWSAALHGAPYDIEHRIVVPGPTPPEDASRGPTLQKWVRERAVVTLDGEGKPVKGIGTVQDVTERRRAEQRLHQLNRAHRALSACNHALVRASDERAWMEEICRLIVEEAGYRLCWVGHAEHDDAQTVRPIAAAGFDEGYLEGLHVSWADNERGHGPTGTCIRTGKPVLSNDIAKNPLFATWRTEALRRGYASSIALPVIVDGRPFGSLNIYAAEPDAFADQEVALLSELTEDLAYGIATLRTRAERNRVLGELRALNAELEQRVESRTADLYSAREREANLAAMIQQQLLLDEPPCDSPGLRVAALTLPSRRIAGDFYGFFQHEGHHCLDLLVADVMGKGVPAALLSAATKSHFPEALWHLMDVSKLGQLPEPQEIVTLAHTRMARQLIDIESFVTLCYTRIDVARQRLTLVDCGHTGVLHLHARTGSCDIMHGDNLPLGVREGEIYGQISAPIERGDLLVFYSDGVTEARDHDGEFFGTERLVACLQRYAASDPNALVRAVHDAVVAFSGAVLADDLTCVVVKIMPYEAPLARSDLQIGSALSELQRARDFVAGFCKALPKPVPEDRIASLVLAVNEAASNVMKHAYHRRDDQHLDITIEAFQERVAVRIRYQGASFDPSSIPPPAFDGSRDSGFGLFMIANSVDAARYYTDDLGRSCILLELRGRTS